LLVILALAIPVIVAANPSDPIWRPGLYDDADTDHLVRNVVSPESLIGVSVLGIVCLLTSLLVVRRTAARSSYGTSTRRQFGV
jgi:hypothetical protein